MAGWTAQRLTLVFKKCFILYIIKLTTFPFKKEILKILADIYNNLLSNCLELFFKIFIIIFR